MKTNIRGTDSICSKNERTNKSNLVGMLCKAAKIIVNTCKSLLLSSH